MVSYIQEFEDNYRQIHQVFPTVKEGFEIFVVVNMLTGKEAACFFSKQYADQRAFYLSKPVLPTEPTEVTLDVTATVR